MKEFAEALKHADKAILCPIYAAREANTWGISSEDIAKLIPGGEAVEDFAHAAKRLEELVRPGDMIFTMGAGNINQLASFLE